MIRVERLEGDRVSVTVAGARLPPSDMTFVLAWTWTEVPCTARRAGVSVA